MTRLAAAAPLWLPEAEVIVVGSGAVGHVVIAAVTNVRGHLDERKRWIAIERRRALELKIRVGGGPVEPDTVGWRRTFSR